MAGLFNAVVSAGKFVKDKLKVISSFKYVFRGVSKRLPKTGGGNKEDCNSLGDLLWTQPR